MVWERGLCEGRQRVGCVATFGLLRVEKSVVGPPKEWFGGSISSLKAGVNGGLIKAYTSTGVVGQVRVQMLLPSALDTNPGGWQ